MAPICRQHPLHDRPILHSVSQQEVGFYPQSSEDIEDEFLITRFSQYGDGVLLSVVPEYGTCLTVTYGLHRQGLL